MGIKEGRLQEKSVVSAYWAKALAMFPDLARIQQVSATFIEMGGERRH
jgi:hypothetical protein